MEKIVFITTGYMPIPAVNGGAVETLVENLLEENEDRNQYNFEVISTYDEAINLKNINIHFSILLKHLD